MKYSLNDWIIFITPNFFVFHRIVAKSPDKQDATKSLLQLSLMCKVKWPFPDEIDVVPHYLTCCLPVGSALP